MVDSSSTTNIYERDLEANKTNYTPLTPLSFISRTSQIYPNLAAVIHGERIYSWAETYARTRKLSSSLKAKGIGKGDTVAIMGANTPELYETHYGVPMVGAILNALNVRLDAAAIAFILNHGEAKILFTDREFSKTIKAALELTHVKPVVIDIDDVLAPKGELLGETNYEDFIGNGDPNFEWQLPNNEWDAISLNYTSGTTGNPKGVVYHHRGAYLNAIGNILAWNMSQGPVYLWTLPMFHCNGWCFPWTIAAAGGTNICLRDVNASRIFDAIKNYRVAHLCGAPIVLSMIVNTDIDQRHEFEHTVKIMTAGASPPVSIIENIESVGFNITHAYGLTETYGPATVCAWHKKWDNQPKSKQAQLKSRQGVAYPVLESLSVRNAKTMEPVEANGKTLGEVMFRGNNLMKGYLKNPAATKEAFAGDYFHSGDLAVIHPDGYIELKDRSKDIIISGGENISSIEVENALYKHLNVMTSAVVAKSDEIWGESPCAFVELKNPAEGTTEEELINHCRDNLAHFKCPRRIIFGPIPKTSTGKIQKFLLRKKAEAL